MQIQLSSGSDVAPTTPRVARSTGIRKVGKLVAREWHVPSAAMFDDSRGRVEVARARQVAMYLAHVVMGERLADIGVCFGRDRTTVSYACHVIEDLREDRSFDSEITRLERALERMGVTYRG